MGDGQPAPAAVGEHLEPHRAGRIHRTVRRVRLADVDTEGFVRLDAVARYLQDVATDDVRSAGVEDAVAWVVRRTAIFATGRPRYGEQMELATWCSGAGSALAERRTSITGERGASVETVSLWVSLDRTTLRPAPLSDDHFAPYRESAAGRRVRGRFLLEAAPGEIAAAGRPVGRPWPLRDADFDLFHHVNNVVSWAAVEEEARAVAGGRRPAWGQVEYRRPIERGETPRIVSRTGPAAVAVWLLGAGGEAATSARLGFA